MNGSLRNASRLYFSAMIAVGAAAMGWAVYGLFEDGIGPQWLLLASLTVVTGSFALKIPGVDSKVSLGDTLIFANLVFFGPAAGILTAVLDGVFGSLSCKSKSRRLVFAAFNAACMAVSAGLGAIAFTAAVGMPIRHHVAGAGISNLLPGIAILALVYYLANSIFVATIVALEQRRGIAAVWREKLVWPIGNYIAAAAFAGIMAQGEGRITPWVVVTILAVLAAMYLGSKTCVEAAGQVSDQAAPGLRR